jgi:predicted GIY-YIG superfamily endonuclease
LIDTTNQKKRGIYKILNKIDGKFYLGSSKDIEHRWIDHIRELQKK